MLSAAGIAGGTDLSGSTSVGYGMGGFAKMTALPYAFSRFGNVYSTAMRNVGTYGNWWSSTASSGSNGYYLALNSSALHPARSSDRLYGFSVRCIAR